MDIICWVRAWCRLAIDGQVHLGCLKNETEKIQISSRILYKGIANLNMLEHTGEIPSYAGNSDLVIISRPTPTALVQILLLDFKMFYRKGNVRVSVSYFWMPSIGICFCASGIWLTGKQYLYIMWISVMIRHAKIHVLATLSPTSAQFRFV